MNKLANYIIAIAGIAVVAFLAWYFSNIVAYILISAVLSLIAKPLVDILCKVKIKGRRIPRWASAIVGLLAIWFFFFAFLYIFIPLIAGLVQQFSTIDTRVIYMLAEPFNRFEETINSVLPADNKFSLYDFFYKEISSIINAEMIRTSFNSIANILVSMLVAGFSISFISFFFMKEEGLFTESITTLSPAKYERSVRRALDSATRLLMRYFVGVFLDMLCVMLTLTIGLVIFTSLDFKTCLVIGLISGILNVIPYVGPVISCCIAIIISVASHIDMLASGEFTSLIIAIVIIFIGMKIIDDAVFQPLIYSNSIKAHPLEIFLVILIAGSFAGIGGMLLAIPAYTVIRVFAKEFFYNLRVVQKLTERM